MVFIFRTRHQVEMTECQGGEIIEVLLTEDPDGSHWCWLDFADESWDFVMPSLAQLDMCFPYGIVNEEALNRGSRVQVRVEEKRKRGLLAQLAERGALNPQVPGSRPGGLI